MPIISSLQGESCWLCDTETSIFVSVQICVSVWVYLHADDSEYFDPDLTVFCDHSKSANDGCHGAPDWIIEIVSPSSKANDYGKKLFKYREAGVKLYWIIDPMREMTLIYDFTEDDKTTGLYPFTEELICSLFEDLKITVADLL